MRHTLLVFCFLALLAASAALNLILLDQGINDRQRYTAALDGAARLLIAERLKASLNCALPVHDRR
jgi:hypothetical protein